jgi:low temperature requirement protein LtrA
VAGIVLFAAGNELALIHPGERADPQTCIGIVAGAMIYLVGIGLFKHTLRGRWQLSHLAGLALLTALGFVARSLPALALAAAGALVLVTVAIWESRDVTAREARVR